MADFTEYDPWDLWAVKVPEDMDAETRVQLIVALQKELKNQFNEARDWSSYCVKLHNELKAAKSEAEARAVVHE